MEEKTFLRRFKCECGDGCEKLISDQGYIEANNLMAEHEINWNTVYVVLNGHEQPNDIVKFKTSECTVVEEKRIL